MRILGTKNRRMDFRRIESPAEDWHQIELPLNEYSKENHSNELISKEQNVQWEMDYKGIRFNDATRFGYLNFKMILNGE